MYVQVHACFYENTLCIFGEVRMGEHVVLMVIWRVWCGVDMEVQNAVHVGAEMAGCLRSQVHRKACQVFE